MLGLALAHGSPCPVVVEAARESNRALFDYIGSFDKGKPIEAFFGALRKWLESPDCRYCMAHTVAGALHNGATEAQLQGIGDYENSDAFSDAERAAFRFAEASGRVPSEVVDTHFDDLRSFFTEAQVMELVGVVSVFGFLNRYNTALATPLEPKPLSVAETYLAPHGWTRGIH